MTPAGALLTPTQRDFLVAARTATLATVDLQGRPRLVPICFVVAEDPPVLYSPLDEKPKSVADPLALARVHDIQARPGVTLLVDRWSEDWLRLGWLRLHGQATVLAPGEMPTDILGRLRTKYPQYADHRLEDRPSLEITIERVTSWGDLSLP